MDILDETKIFPRTKRGIEIRLTELQEKLEINTRELKAIGADQDGDVMDDTNFRNLIAQRELMQSEQITLNWLVGSPVLEVTESNNLDTVVVGSKIKMKVTYPDGKKEIINVTIVGAKEAKYLPPYINDNDSDIIMSSEAPIAKAAVGMRLNTQSKFNAPDGEGIIQIIDIQMSDYLMLVES